MMKKKLKGGAEKLRLKKMINFKAVANDPKQKKIEFGLDRSNKVFVGKSYNPSVSKLFLMIYY